MKLWFRFLKLLISLGIFGTIILLHNIQFYSYFKLIIKYQNISINKNIKNISSWFIKKNQISIFCIVLTQRNSLQFKAPVTYEAWLNKCDDYRFLTLLPSDSDNNSIIESRYEVKYKYNLYQSSKNDPFFSKYKQKHQYIKLLSPPGLINDSYGKLTDKIYLSFKHIYKNYKNYDWYLKCDDDTFVYFENLIKFLKDKNKTEPVSYGRLVGEYTNGFLSGGGGYVMSQEAFSRLGSRLTQNYSFCSNSGSEDVDVSQCLHKLKSKIGKSTDDMNRCRFHSNHLFTVYPSEYPHHCCSDTFVTFHRIKPKEQIKMSQILEDSGYNHTFKDMIYKMSSSS